MSKSTSRPLITLTTDFGVGSPYVAQMRGVILSRNPSAQIIDITHGIPPQDVHEGALVLGDVCHRFPPHTIHIAVVDPGVGTDRRLVCATVDGRFFIAPDNGLLTMAVQGSIVTQVVAITNRTYFQHEVSTTFHGRDVMAPVAAHLSLGLSPRRLGELVSPESLQRLSIAAAVVEPNRISGEVIQVDSFGNLITNILGDLLLGIEDRRLAVVTCGGRAITGIVPSYAYAPTGQLIATVGSTGRLELAVVNGSAAAELSAGRGVELEVRW